MGPISKYQFHKIKYAVRKYFIGIQMQKTNLFLFVPFRDTPDALDRLAKDTQAQIDKREKLRSSL